ncbi:class II aldolase/adducin family protein [Jonesiaceae bacterium BS-20]|uniref:Class II aldolase/adducin family protein n=1 Tax=Jonesiaceae bacterium BS-20 TaxID=3120821 RepID=A0AAU7DTG8_9MICO
MHESSEASISGKFNLGEEAVMRRQIVDIGRRMWQRGLVAANDGNISVRLANDTVLCTPTGVSKGNLTEEMLAVVALTGELIDAGTGGGPSSEIKMHLKVYQLDQHTKAVVHAHPPYSTAFAIRGEELHGDLMTETLTALPSVPVAQYATPGTEEVSDSIQPFVASHKACLLEHHGALSWGNGLEEAYLTMERVESLAQTTALLRMIGGERKISPERIAHSLARMESH